MEYNPWNIRSTFSPHRDFIYLSSLEEDCQGPGDPGVPTNIISKYREQNVWDCYNTCDTYLANKSTLLVWFIYKEKSLYLFTFMHEHF